MYKKANYVQEGNINFNDVARTCYAHVSRSPLHLHAVFSTCCSADYEHLPSLFHYAKVRYMIAHLIQLDECTMESYTFYIHRLSFADSHLSCIKHN